MYGRGTKILMHKPSKRLVKFLRQNMGYMTDRVSWMHSKDIAVAHQDIKPANLLLRNGRLFVTDFGISRDRRDALATYMERHHGKPDGWRPPEVAAKMRVTLS